MIFYNRESLRLNYEIIGNGEPLVLIAGITCSVQHWTLIKDSLSKFFCLIMLDNRGVGLSDAPSELYNVSNMSDDVIDLLNHLQYDKVYILGHSLGGAVAQYLGAFHPDRVRKLIVSHSFIKFNPTSIMFCEHDYLLKEIGASAELRATNVLSFIYSDEFVQDKQKVQVFIENIRNQGYTQSLQSYRQQIDVISKFDSRSFLDKILTKTLIISGLADKLVPHNDSEEMKDLMIHSQHQQIIGAHVPMWEHPSLYVDMLVRFLLTSDSS